MFSSRSVAWSYQLNCPTSFKRTCLSQEKPLPTSKRVSGYSHGWRLPLRAVMSLKLKRSTRPPQPPIEEKMASPVVKVSPHRGLMKGIRGSAPQLLLGEIDEVSAACRGSARVEGRRGAEAHSPQDLRASILVDLQGVGERSGGDTAQILEGAGTSAAAPPGRPLKDLDQRHAGIICVTVPTSKL